MPHRTFFAFIFPSILAMLLFITLPIISVAMQSLFVEHPAVVTEVENCGPFGCTTETKVDTEAMAKLKADQPMGAFAGFSNYLNHNHLAVDDLRAIFGDILAMVITPLGGSLVPAWIFNPAGIFGATLQSLTGDPTLSLRASPVLTWIVILTYGVWTNGPFSFVVFYAGLQTVPKDTLESARIDGATRWQATRFVIIPHLMPLATFVALVQLMDNFRVFEPIVGFSAEANATSLSWLVFNDLVSQDSQQFGSAAATSVITIVGVLILLTPVLIRTWRDFNRKAV